ncbi:MAG: hypothetical protein II859_02425 [Bacteroidales bacterium]|nr:hypothetical protein [Bacteroidales bacterium]
MVTCGLSGHLPRRRQGLLSVVSDSGSDSGATVIRQWSDSDPTVIRQKSDSGPTEERRRCKVAAPQQLNPESRIPNPESRIPNPET